MYSHFHVHFVNNRLFILSPNKQHYVLDVFFVDLTCPPVFDNVMCWNVTRAGTNASQPCPGYIDNFRVNGDYESMNIIKKVYLRV